MIYIGGASAAGKSSAAKQLSAQCGAPVVELDKYFNILTRIGCGEIVAEQGMRDLSRTLVEDFLRADTRCIVEGGWINPDAIAALKKEYGEKLQTAYCGHLTADVESLLASIVAKGEHWLAKKPSDEARAFLLSQIKGSEWYQSECKKHNVRFFDFSDQAKGVECLVRYFIDCEKIANVQYSSAQQRTL